MYKFVYCYIFQLAKKRNPTPDFNASGFVWIMQFIHIALILAIVKKVLKIEYFRFSDTYFYNKLVFAPIAILWLILTYRYYKKRTDKIINVYSGKKMITFKNSVIVFSLLLIPLFIMIQLLKK